jgi:hypothetical protein
MRVERLWGLKVISDQISAIRKQEKPYTEVTENAEFAEKRKGRGWRLAAIVPRSLHWARAEKRPRCGRDDRTRKTGELQELKV